ncbi:MAG: thioesterase family protein [Chitinophagaceae bacterium]|jgi:acyl-CoA thioesterase FadM|nr:thioesterase family protein [Chitinophagaceae bacterium]
MQRIKIDLPARFAFSTQLAVRITDLNYGNHVGNDAFMALLHEARVQYLHSLGYGELDVAGYGLIMADAAIQFKAELHYGQVLTAEVAATGLASMGFDLVYRLTVEKEGRPTVAAIAKTGMVLFDYQQRKPVALPADVQTRLQTTATE